MANAASRFFHPLPSLLLVSIMVISSLVTHTWEISIIVFLLISMTAVLTMRDDRSRKTLLSIITLTTLFSIIRLLLIGITLTRSVDITSITSSAQSMATLASIVIAFCTFSFLVGPHRIVHLIPRRWRTLRETTQITSNILWRTPTEVQLISEAQYNFRDQSRFHAIRHVFPVFISELVQQSPTHAGVNDLRKSAISHRSRWYRFRFSRHDVALCSISIFFLAVVIGIHLLGEL